MKKGSEGPLEPRLSLSLWTTLQMIIKHFESNKSQDFSKLNPHNNNLTSVILKTSYTLKHLHCECSDILKVKFEYVF
jgi:hypothetical protein